MDIVELVTSQQDTIVRWNFLPSFKVRNNIFLVLQIPLGIFTFFHNFNFFLKCGSNFCCTELMTINSVNLTKILKLNYNVFDFRFRTYFSALIPIIYVELATSKQVCWNFLPSFQGQKDWIYSQIFCRNCISLSNENCTFLFTFPFLNEVGSQLCK